jgi:hypothetical protein
MAAAAAAAWRSGEALNIPPTSMKPSTNKIKRSS